MRQDVNVFPLIAIKSRLLVKAGLILVLLHIGEQPLLQAQTVPAIPTNIQDLLGARDQWKTFAEEGRRFSFDARFHGRGADSFRVHRMDIDFRLPGSIRFPDRMRDKQRLDIVGKFVSVGNRMSFSVTGLTVRETDLERLDARVREISPDDAETLIRAAEEFRAAAEFYADDALRARISETMTNAVEQLRSLARGNVSELHKTAERGRLLHVSPSLIQSIEFEILIAESLSTERDVDRLLQRVRLLAGADVEPVSFPPRLLRDFPAEAAERYREGGDKDRQLLHRLLYRYLRKIQITQMLKADGSNGLLLAESLLREFPGDKAEAQVFVAREMAFQLGRVPDLSRAELLQVMELLREYDRESEIPESLNRWLEAQERRFGTVQLDGLIRTADEYLFVSENWKNTHHRERGIELLKQGWTQANRESPQDAVQIAERLRRLGWEHFDGRWLTLEQMQLVPKDDIQLAIREGRVVKGMTPQQVTQTLGKPARVTRLGTSRTMRELWIYDGTTSAGLVVRFRRSLTIPSDQNVVEDVSRISSR